MSWALTTDQITRLQIELTNYCNAGCPHCARVNYLSTDWVQGYKQKSPYPVSINSTHLDIDRYKQMIINDQWQSLRDVHYCGNYDEPTVHPKIFEFIDCTVEHLPQVKSISIATNGGTRDGEWWQQLGEKSSQLKQRNIDLRVVWGIDGLEDTNHIYRKGVNWNKLKENYTAYNQAGGNSTWQFIVFDHNEHQLNEIESNYKAWGFNSIKIINSNRKNPQIKIDNSTKKKYVQHDTSNQIKNTPINKKIPSISPKNDAIFTKKDTIFCKALEKNSIIKRSLYITAHGFVTPCCWMGTDRSLKEGASSFSQGLSPEIHSIYSQDSITDILNSPYFSQLQSAWNNRSYVTCNEKCSTAHNPDIQNITKR